MLCSKREFKKLGYKLEYSSCFDYLPLNNIVDGKRLEISTLQKACKGYRDIVFLAFHHTTSYLGKCSEKERGKILSEIKKHCRVLVWLDTADSTGTCLFDVMPYVDLYFKKQLLKDVSIYEREVWGARIYCEYYHKKLGIDDENVTSRIYPKLNPNDKNKLRVSWNVGVGDLFASTLQLYLHPFSRTIPHFVNPTDKRKNLDLQYRGSSFSPVAGYQRQYCKEVVSKIDHITHSDPYKKVPHDEYVREGMQAKAIMSPFGWGEVCGRDFEAFVYGATMIKMDMGHCVTYPDAYQPGKTYVPVKWDFEDLEQKLKDVKTKEYRNIAIYAQEWYKGCFEERFRGEFAKHIVQELEMTK